MKNKQNQTFNARVRQMTASFEKLSPEDQDKLLQVLTEYSENPANETIRIFAESFHKLFSLAKMETGE